MSTHLIAIGNELLTGEVTDTNSGWLIRELNHIGLKVSRISIIEDNEVVLKKLLGDALSEGAKYVLVTGGMGATKDDITKKAISDFFNTDLYLDQEVLDNVKKVLKLKNKPFLDIMEKQAMVPYGTRIIPNEMGTAPGIIMETQNTLFAFLPGVPHEMKHLVKPALLEIIQKSNVNFTKRKSAIFSKTEIEVSNILETIDFSEFKMLNIAYLLHEKGVKINIENTGTNRAEIDRQMQMACTMIATKLKKAFGGIEVSFK